MFLVITLRQSSQAIIFSRYKRFGLSDVSQRNLEGNTVVKTKGEVSTTAIRVIHETSLCGLNVGVLFFPPPRGAAGSRGPWPPHS